MFLKPLDSITAEDVSRLVDIGAAETVSREFKSIVPWGTQGPRKDLVTHISAIANAGGGDILFGIEENNGVAVEAVGIDVPNLDELQRGIEQSVRDGTDPSLTGLRFRAIEGFEKGPVLILRVPRTWTGPHMLTLDKDSRFYIRDTGSKHIMNTHELRMAFNRADEPAALARRYREERLTAIRNNDGAAPLISGPKLVIHVFPLAAFDDSNRRNVIPGLPDPTVWNITVERGVAGQFNADGYICKQSRGGNVNCFDYMQLFRWGPIEIVTGYFLRDDGAPYLPYDYIERYLLTQSSSGLSLLGSLGFNPPFVIMPTLMGVKGFGFPNNAWIDREPIDRDDVVMPETVLYDYPESNALDRALCDSLDVMWNALGFSERMFSVQNGGLREWRSCHPENKPQVDQH